MSRRLSTTRVFKLEDVLKRFPGRPQKCWLGNLQRASCLSFPSSPWWRGWSGDHVGRPSGLPGLDHILVPSPGGVFFSQPHLNLTPLNFTKTQCGTDHACGICGHFREVLSRILLILCLGVPRGKLPSSLTVQLNQLSFCKLVDFLVDGKIKSLGLKYTQY